VFWVHASNTARLEQSFREIADEVKVRGRKDPQADVFKLVHDWLSDKENGPWLLVLDNADDAAVLSPTGNGSKLSSSSNNSALQQHLSRYLPSSRHGSVLVTSRTKRAAREVVEDCDIIAIEPMPDASAHALIRKKLGGIMEEDNNIAKLAMMLDHIPLALVQAAAYIRERAPRCSVRQYLEEYQQSDSRKTSLLNQEAGHLRRDRAGSNSVLTTWQISFDHIRSTRQSAAGLLSLMSFFDRQGIQDYLLHHQSSTAAERVSATQNDNGFEDDVLALRDYSFITVTRDANTFQMHSLVQLAMRTWLKNQGQLDKWREQFISNLCAELPTGEHKNWEKCQALFPHARAALAHRPKDRESLKKWALLLYKAAWYAWQRGRAGEAEEMSVISMKVRIAELGDNNVETLSSMRIVGLARALGGKYKEAEAMNRQTLERSERVLGREHPSTLTSMSNLASVLNRQGRYEEAEAMNRQTLAQSEKVLGHEHPDTLKSMANLASTYRDQGRWKDSEELDVQVMETSLRALGKEHPDTLTSIANLASTYSNQGRWKEAEELEVQVIETRKRVLGEAHPDTLTSMANLASTYSNQGRWKEAEELEVQVVETRKRVLGEEHPNTLISMANLASTNRNQGRWREAEELEVQVMETRKRVLGEAHPDTLTSMSNLADVLGHQGKYKEAEAMNRQTLALKEKVLGREHSSTLDTVSNLGNLYKNLGQFDKAETMYLRALQGKEKAWGPEHTSTLDTVNNLGILYKNLGRLDEAEKMYQRALQGYEQRVQRTVPTAAYDTSVRRRQPYVGGLLLAGP
jgi:tetratricopeptide (TPR) repeat protein